jgi:uncharacterized repeat protein (TIGR01451 family)
MTAAALVLAAAAGFGDATVWGQAKTRAPRYFPLDQTVQPGMAGQWARTINPEPPVFQPVRLFAPGGEGEVTFYGMNTGEALVSQGRGEAALIVGPVYRCKIAAMPDYPGVELYPSIELVDRLHPPAGQEGRFPIPVAFTPQEIDAAVDGQMVLKVVYVEQPDLAMPTAHDEPLPTQELESSRNPLAEADLLGRPVAIVRLGGRMPDASGRDDMLMRSHGPLGMVNPPDEVAGGTRNKANGAIQQAGHFRRRALKNCPPGEMAGETLGEDCPVDADCPACEPISCPVGQFQAIAKQYPDEYICDGGDRNHPVHFDNYNMLGLDTEDTVAQYKDHKGKSHLKPTNKVCLYAPRLAAVDVIQHIGEDTGVHRAGTNTKNELGINLRSRQVTVAQHQRQASERMVTRVRGSGLESRTAAREVDLDVAVVTHTQALVAVGAHSFLRTGQFKQVEEAVIADGVQAAATWTKTQFPVVAAQLESSGELVSKNGASELVGTEDRRKPGRLRIVKLADKKQAEAGDIVTFTIRYDNLGELPLTEVTITDNLTPRLAYVDDSATSDRDGRLDVIDNGEGSVILRWVMDQPLDGKKGGVVTFQAKVR